MSGSREFAADSTTVRGHRLDVFPANCRKLRAGSARSPEMMKPRDLSPICKSLAKRPIFRYDRAMTRREVLATRRSMIERLGDWNDRARWQQFFDSYWRLIHGTARKAGLTEVEAQEVVQETLITVAKKIDQLRYDPEIGSFKGWLLNITRWRIADQFRKRKPDQQRASLTSDRDEARTATIERIADPAGADLDEVWDEEWRKNVVAGAVARVKRKVDPRQYQVFDCYVFKQWPAQKVAAELRVNVAQVYLIKHRIGALLKKEIAASERLPVG
jgi:RNA polymerase sigma-70 factor (ECF subfamily)